MKKIWNRKDKTGDPRGAGTRLPSEFSVSNLSTLASTGSSSTPRRSEAPQGTSIAEGTNTEIANNPSYINVSTGSSIKDKRRGLVVEQEFDGYSLSDQSTFISASATDPVNNNDNSNSQIQIPDKANVSYSTPQHLSETSKRNILKSLGSKKSSNSLTTSPSISSLAKPHSSSRSNASTGTFKAQQKKANSYQLGNQQPSSSKSSSHDVPWDQEIIKLGWLNRDTSSNSAGDIEDKMKLCRAEIKGSVLLIYKTPNEISDIKSMRPNNQPTTSNISAPTPLTIPEHVQSNSHTPPPASPPAMITTTTDSESIAVSDVTLMHNSNKSSSSFSMVDEKEADTDEMVENGNGQSENTDKLETESFMEPASTFVDDDLKSLRSKRSATNFDTASTSDVVSKQNVPYSSSKNIDYSVDSVNLVYSSIRYPHPELIIDNTNGTVLTGPIESVCHGILFCPYTNTAKRLLEVVPLLFDIGLALTYINKYFDLFVELQDKKDTLNENNHPISKDSEANLIERIKLVAESIKDHYPGMLLEPSIYKALWNLILAVDIRHNCDTLKHTIHQKEQSLSLLLEFEDQFHILQLDNFSSEEFLNSNMQQLSKEINLINLKFSGTWDARLDPSLLYESTQDNYTYYRKNPLIFEMTRNIHWLGRLLTYHLFDDPKSSKDPVLRAQVLSKWIELGSCFDKIGDMVSWLAIATLVCSMPVLRLTVTWFHVDEQLIKLVNANWAPVVFELDKRSFISFANNKSSYHVIAPQGIGKVYPKKHVIPYYGDLFFKKPDQYSRIIPLCEKHIFKIDASFKRWTEYLQLVEDDPSLPQDNDNSLGESIFSDKLFALLNTHISMPPLTIEIVMEKSLLIEPVYSVSSSIYHDSSRSPLFLGSYASILFPNVSDSYTIYDQNALFGALGSNLNSNSSSMFTDFANTSPLIKENGEEPKAKTNGRNYFLKNVRDLFDVNTAQFRVHRDILFKTMNPGKEIRQDLQKERKKNRASRTSSMLMSESNNVKRFSSYSSSSFNFDENRNSLSTNPKSSSAGTTATSEVSVEILTKAATLDKLIDLLVLTSSIFGSEIEQEDVISYLGTGLRNSTESVLFKMDNGIFTMTFFATYRGFCSTLTLLEKLTSRFSGATSAAISIAQRQAKGLSSDIDFTNFPDWSSNDSSLLSTASVNWKYVAQIEIGILEVLSILVQDYYDHFIDDVRNKAVFNNLLRIIDNEINTQWVKVLGWLEVNDQLTPEIQDLYDQISQLYKKMRKVYIKNCYKPRLLPFKFVDFTSSKSLPMDLPFPKSFAECEEYVVRFDKFIKPLFKDVTVSDWLATFEILEIHVAKSPLNLACYDTQRMTNNPEQINISNVFDWIYTLADFTGSSKISSSIFEQLPLSVQYLIKLYYKFKFYITAKITETSISPSERLEVMACILQMIQICRVKMKYNSFFDVGDSPSSSSRIRGFMESCLCNSVLSVESRVFGSSWIEASRSLDSETDFDSFDRASSPIKETQTSADSDVNDIEGIKTSAETQQTTSSSPKKVISETDSFYEARASTRKQAKMYDTILDLLPKESITENQLQDKSTAIPCVGWILERLLEIICFIPNMSVENTKLINFDKRRFAYNCVTNLVDIVCTNENTSSSLESDGHLVSIASSETSESSEFDFLFDLEVSKIEVSRDLQYAAGTEAPKKFMKSHIEQQFRLLKTESARKTLLLKQDSERLIRTRENGVTLTVKQKPTIEQRQRGNTLTTLKNSTKGVVAVPARAPNRSNKFNITGLLSKASRPFSMGMGGFNNQPQGDRVVDSNELPVVGSLGNNYKPFLQISLKDFSIFPVYRVSAGFKISSANSPPTEHFFQASSEAERDDWIYKCNFAKKHWFLSKNYAKLASGNIVFGMPIDFVAMREGRPIPGIIEKIFSEIEYRGLEEVGIYRKSASLSMLKNIKSEIDKHGDLNMENQLVFDVHNLTGCIKLYLRELPEPLVPDELVPDFLAIKDLLGEEKTDKRMALYHEVLPKLPYYNFNLIQRLIYHMKLIHEYSEVNKMTSTNLATVLGGTFLEGAKPDIVKSTFGLMNLICEDMILRYDTIFNLERDNTESLS